MSFLDDTYCELCEDSLLKNNGITISVLVDIYVEK